MSSNFKPQDKVWIYTSIKPFDEKQLEIINDYAIAFVENWESHGAKVRGEINIIQNTFISIIADDCDGHMCGRAQDAQARFAKELSDILGVNLLDRMLVAYQGADNHINVIPLNDLKSVYQSGQIDDDTIVFDNTISTFDQFEKEWKKPLKDSWITRFLS